VRPLLDPDVDPEPRRQRLLQPDAHAQPDHGREAAVRDGGRDVDGADGEGGAGGEWGEVDVGEVDDGEGAEGEGVFGVGYGGDEVCEVGEKLANRTTNGEMGIGQNVGARARVKAESPVGQGPFAEGLQGASWAQRMLTDLHTECAGSPYAQAIDPVICTLRFGLHKGSKCGDIRSRDHRMLECTSS